MDTLSWDIEIECRKYETPSKKNFNMIKELEVVSMIYCLRVDLYNSLYWHNHLFEIEGLESMLEEALRHNYTLRWALQSEIKCGYD